MMTTAHHFTANEDTVKTTARNVNAVKTTAQHFTAKEKYSKDDSMTHHDPLAYIIFMPRLCLIKLNDEILKNRDKSATLALR
jgi:hypothetical protein